MLLGRATSPKYVARGEAACSSRARRGDDAELGGVKHTDGASSRYFSGPRTLELTPQPQDTRPELETPWLWKPREAQQRSR